MHAPLAVRVPAAFAFATVAALFPVEAGAQAAHEEVPFVIAFDNPCGIGEALVCTGMQEIVLGAHEEGSAGRHVTFHSHSGVATCVGQTTGLVCHYHENADATVVAHALEHGATVITLLNQARVICPRPDHSFTVRIIEQLTVDDAGAPTSQKSQLDGPECRSPKGR